jgi:hypothetical protein
MALVLYQCHCLNDRHRETLVGQPDPVHGCKVFDGTCSSIAKKNFNCSARLAYQAPGGGGHPAPSAPRAGASADVDCGCTVDDKDDDDGGDGHGDPSLLARPAGTRMMLPAKNHRRALLSLLKAGAAGLPVGPFALRVAELSPIRSLFRFVKLRRPELAPFLLLEVAQILPPHPLIFKPWPCIPTHSV